MELKPTGKGQGKDKERTRKGQGTDKERTRKGQGKDKERTRKGTDMEEKINAERFTYSRCPKFQPSNNNFNLCTYYNPAENPADNPADNPAEKEQQECGFCKRPEYYRCLADDRQIPLSYSSVSNFLTCHHLYYLTAIRGIQIRDAAKSSPLKMGTLWDKALQKHLGQIDIDIPAIINQYEIEARDTAKVKSVYRAYKDLAIQVEPSYHLQAKVNLTIPFDRVWGDGYPVEMRVAGFYDRKYAASFAENKLSGRPEMYQDPWFIQSQIGTYFLADPSLESCTMEIVRTPDLKSTGKHKEEDADTYEERVYQDIISRPSHYFIGWNTEKHTYGRKFHRAEFDLEELKSRYLHVFREIYEAKLFDGWWKSDKSCKNVLPGIQCDMLSICRYNTLAENIYQMREKPVTF